MPTAAEKAANRRASVEQFMRREIDWKTLLAVWVPEEDHGPEPTSAGDHVEWARTQVAVCQSEQIKLQHVLAATEKLRKEVERLCLERPKLANRLAAFMVRICDLRAVAIRGIPLWKEKEEQLAVFGADAEGMEADDAETSSP